MAATSVLRLLGVAALWCGAVSLVAAREPNPLQQAQPCRDAVLEAETAIDPATSPHAYARTLSQLAAAVERFVKDHGEGEETSLHGFNAHGSALLHRNQSPGRARRPPATAKPLARVGRLVCAAAEPTAVLRLRPIDPQG